MTNKLLGSKVGSPYSEALFQLALNLFLEKNDSEIFYQIIFDIQSLLRILVEMPSLEEYLINPLVSAKNKKIIIEKLLENSNLNTVHFINLLIDKKRISFVKNILRRFLLKAYHFVGIKFVDVYSAIPLNEEQEEELKIKINQMFEPNLSTSSSQPFHLKLILRIDPMIIGGLLIKIDSKVIDVSVRGQLQSLTKKLLLFNG